MTTYFDGFTKEVIDDYVAGLRGAERAVGICEDYRASATIDLEHDRADRLHGRLITVPLRLLWGRNGVIEQLFPTLRPVAQGRHPGLRSRA
jgi:haloacetate dehalogenase